MGPKSGSKLARPQVNSRKCKALQSIGEARDNGTMQLAHGYPQLLRRPWPQGDFAGTHDNPKKLCPSSILFWVPILLRQDPRSWPPERTLRRRSPTHAQGEPSRASPSFLEALKKLTYFFIQSMLRPTETTKTGFGYGTRRKTQLPEKLSGNHSCQALISRQKGLPTNLDNTA